MIKSLLLSTTLLTLLASQVAVGQVAVSTADNDPLYDIFAKAASSPTVPGISVAVANEQGIQYALGVGYANIEHGIAMTPHTKMRIGSVAKTLATAGLMRLYDQGKIDLDAPIRHYVPQWPKKHATLTLRQLTMHSAGIRHYKGDEFLMNKDYKTTVEALDIFKNDPLKFAPGSKYSYSTYAWTLISAAMETASGGKTFKQIMRDEVFTPLDMKETTFDDLKPLISNRQSPYTVEKGQLVNSLSVFNSYKYAGGGFLATPSDVSRFAVAHAKAGYLKSETLKKIFSKATLSDGTKSPHGIGWVVGFGTPSDKKLADPKYKKIIAMMKRHKNSVMHSGGSMGGSTMMILCLDHNHAVTVVKNVNGDSSANVFNLALTALDYVSN